MLGVAKHAGDKGGKVAGVDSQVGGGSVGFRVGKCIENSELGWVSNGVVARDGTVGGMSVGAL